MGFPDGSVVKNPPVNAGDEGSIPGLGRSLGKGNSNPLQYSCLENPHGQRSLAGYSPRGQKVRHDLVTKQHMTYNSSFYSFQVYGCAALSTLTCKHHLHRIDFSPDCNLGLTPTRSAGVTAPLCKAPLYTAAGNVRAEGWVSASSQHPLQVQPEARPLKRGSRDTRLDTRWNAVGSRQVLQAVLASGRIRKEC